MPWRAGAEGLAATQAQPQAGHTLGIGRAVQPHRIRLVPRRQFGVQQHQRHRCAAQRGLQRGGFVGRVRGGTQPVGQQPQLFGLLGVAARGGGLAPQPCHQRRGQPADGQQATEQQGMLLQVHREPAARRHEQQVEGRHGHEPGQTRQHHRRPQRREHRADEVQQRQVGQVQPVLQRQQRGPGQGPGRERPGQALQGGEHRGMLPEAVSGWHQDRVMTDQAAPPAAAWARRRALT